MNEKTGCRSSRLMNILLFSLLFFFLNSQSQCLDFESNGNEGGYFDSEFNSGSNENESSYWYTNNSGQQSTFTRDTEDYYYGSGALKVVVNPSDDYSSNAVRMWTRSGNCPMTITQNQSWNVSFYVKGEIGDKLEFLLIDSDNSWSSDSVKSDQSSDNISDGI